MKHSVGEQRQREREREREAWKKRRSLVDIPPHIIS